MALFNGCQQWLSWAPGKFSTCLFSFTLTHSMPLPYMDYHSKGQTCRVYFLIYCDWVLKRMKQLGNCLQWGLYHTLRVSQAYTHTFLVAYLWWIHYLKTVWMVFNQEFVIIVFSILIRKWPIWSYEVLTNCLQERKLNFEFIAHSSLHVWNQH